MTSFIDIKKFYDKITDENVLKPLSYHEHIMNEAKKAAHHHKYRNPNQLHIPKKYVKQLKKF